MPTARAHRRGPFRLSGSRGSPALDALAFVGHSSYIGPTGELSAGIDGT